MYEHNVCENCGCTNEDLVEIEVNGEEILVCADCAEALGFVRCSNCGEWVPTDECYETAEGDRICADCYDSDYFTCEDCGEIYPNDCANVVDRHTYDERYVCDDCLGGYTECDDCGEYFSDDHIYQDNHWNRVCHRCYDWHDWSTCEDCGRLIASDDAYWNDRDGCMYCSDCYTEHEPRNLNDYSFKPTPEFQYRSSELKALDASVIEPRAAIHSFGVELEVDDGDDADELCEALEELDEPIYMKHDGSLHSEGVEIVTHPCSLAYHQYEMRWAEIMRVSEKHGYKSHDTTTCGLHIHVGRSSMGATEKERDAVAGKLVILTNAVWDELVTFSRRTESKLEHWAKRPNLGQELRTLADLDDTYILTYALETEHAGRYQAVNLTNYATVEFRLFRGTLKRQTLIAAIQLVSNMTKFAMTHTPKECLSATWSDILAVEQFKELKAYSESRGL